jgi:hypothetical protein
MFARLTLAYALTAALAKLALAQQNEPFNPTFYLESWTDSCETGKAQSPINIDSKAAQDVRVPDDLVTEPTMPSVSGVNLTNTGSGLKASSQKFSIVTTMCLLARACDPAEELLLEVGSLQLTRARVIFDDICNRRWHVPSSCRGPRVHTVKWVKRR